MTVETRQSAAKAPVEQASFHSDDAATKDAAARARILAHMNADHADSLSRYLQHHFHLSAFTTRNALATDIAPAYLRLSLSAPPDADFTSAAGRANRLSKTSYLVPFDPPLASLSAARARLVELDASATATLGLSPITVKRYAAPRGPAWVSIVLTVTVYALLHSRRWVRPGSALAGYWPAAAEWLARWQPWIFWPLIGAHAVEAVQMAVGNLRFYSVRPLGGVWWAWVIGTFLEGFTSGLRFKRVVKEEEKAKAAKKH